MRSISTKRWECRAADEGRTRTINLALVDVQNEIYVVEIDLGEMSRSNVRLAWGIVVLP